MQTTLMRSAGFSGVGLHSGKPVRMTVAPAAPDHGIVFQRSDLPVHDSRIRVCPQNWEAAALCTVLRNDAGAHVSTIEHVMAALAGCGIHNALVRLDGAEVPILDGSAAPFVAGIVDAGLKVQGAPLRVLRVLQPVEVRDGRASARLEPALHPEIRFEIDFPDAAIGHQSRRILLQGDAFVRDLADSRTFCRSADVDAMRRNGLALGGSLDNAVVVDGASVLTPGGLRHADEPVRHKMLDALGDLAVAGHPFVGRYVGRRAGHALTGALLQKLLGDPAAFRVERCDARTRGRLPNAGAEVLALSA